MTDEIKEEFKKELKNCEESKSEKKEKDHRKSKEKPSVSFEFSDSEVEEFKAWKEAKSASKEVVCDAADDDKVYRMWKEESRMVKGIFRCREPEGGNVKFAFRKYKWDPTRWYTMFDGESYLVPLAVARHLNQNCSYPIHSHILGVDGSPTVDVKGRVKSRMNFESTEFSIV